MNNDVIMFRFVPTMRCNFRCEYCFLDNKQKSESATMFDHHTVDEWINAMKLFSNYKIELYFWGGEPFCIPDTYHLLRELVKMDNIISGIRIDTNVFFAERIAKECPSSKIKLNCSYHMQYHTLEEEIRKIKILKQLDMVGMINFVASKYNIEHLKNDYNMTVRDLINKFDDIDVFVNVAGDFAYANNKNYERYDEYKEFISQFTSPIDWEWLRNEHPEERYCTAGQKMFTVEHNGDFTSCISKDKIYGNIFKGELIPEHSTLKCKKYCPSIVSYPFRCDNDFTAINSMMAYIERQKQHRASCTSPYINYIF